jgi:PAS domain S-box-containing protein
MATTSAAPMCPANPSIHRPCVADWLDALDEGHAALDRDLTVLYANAALAAGWGRTPGELIGRPLPEAVPAFAGSVAEQACRGVLASGRPVETQESVDGRFYDLRACPIPEGVLLRRADVTVRRQFEEELLQSALSGRLLIEQMPTVNWAVDHDLRFTLSAGAGLRALGLQPNEVVGLTLHEYLATTDPGGDCIRRHREALSGATVRFTQELQGLFFDVVLEPLRDGAGRITGVIGVAHDVTELHRAVEERSRLQEQVFRAQKLESLGVLAGGVAHDFNNLLTGILSAAELLLRDLPGDSSLRQLAAVIKQAGERAADVTRQMLVYAGRGRSRRQPLDLNELVRENFPLTRAALPPTADVRQFLAPCLPPIHADPGQMQQVVMNLLLNAADALGNSPAGLIVVRTGTVDVAPSPTENGLSPGRYVFLEVQDNGCGMTAEVQARIFDPFFTTKQRGRGLGLSAVQGIIHAHQGVIRLSSTPGQGTTFRVLLPAAEFPLTLSAPAPGLS